MYDIVVPETFTHSINGNDWNVIGWNSSVPGSNASLSNTEPNTLHKYDPSTNTFILINNNTIEANMGYWVKPTQGSTSITVTPTTNSSNMRIISNNITIDTSKIHSNNVVDLSNKPTFNTTQTKITDDNIRFMLLDWYFNKENTEYIHEHISKWDVSHVTSFEKLFYMMPEFNDDISNWDTSNVVDMSYMFINCSKFNNDIRKWNIEKVTNFKGMFKRINPEFINNYDRNNNIDMFGNPNRKFFN
jgi:surface protein